MDAGSRSCAKLCHQTGLIIASKRGLILPSATDFSIIDSTAWAQSVPCGAPVAASGGSGRHDRGEWQVEQSKRCMDLDWRWIRRASGALIYTLFASALVGCEGKDFGDPATAALTPSVAAPPPTTMFPPDRVTTWNPGVPGGVLTRSKVCANIFAAT